MLQMGASRHWQDAFEAITGQRDMDGGALLEYFKPLMDWLVEENNRTAEHIGWQHYQKVNACHNALQPEPTVEVVPADDGCHYSFDEHMVRMETMKVKKTADSSLNQ